MRRLLLLLVIIAAGCRNDPLDEARRRLEAGDYARAAEMLTPLAARRHSSEAYILLGRAQLMQFDADAARASFRKALQLNRRARPEIARESVVAAKSIYLGEHTVPNQDFALATLREAVGYDRSVGSGIAEWAVALAARDARRPGASIHLPLLQLALSIQPSIETRAAALLRESVSTRLAHGEHAGAAAWAEALAQLLPAQRKDAAAMLRDAALKQDSAGDLEGARRSLASALALDPSLSGELDVVLLRSKLKLPGESVVEASGKPAAGKEAPLLVTMNNLGALSRAIVQYQHDYGMVPETESAERLVRLLVPAYVEHAEPVDGWGHPLRYFSDQSLHDYRLVSAGADGELEETTTTFHSRENPVLADNPDLDIIYEDGVCVQCPSQKLILASSGPR